MSRIPLRLRVALAYGLIGLVLSLVFAGATLVVAEDYETIIVQTMLDGEARTYLQRLHDDPATTLPVSEGFAGYREDEAPLPYRGLANGIHDLEDATEPGLHVGVVGDPGNRLVFVVRLGRVEMLEHYLMRMMVVIVLGGTLLAGWLGWLLAQRTIAPVVRLADAVDALPLRPVPTALQATFGRDDIGRLAGAIDAYQQRLVDVDSTDRTFFANASHELRTPIAVIQGAVEVMKDDPALSAGQVPRMDRIDRALLELGALLEALLLSARGVPAEREPVDVTAAIDEAIDRVAAGVPDIRRRLEFAPGGSQVLPAPRRWLSAILTVLLQRVMTRAPGSRWRLQFADGAFSLARIDGAGEAATAAGGDRSDLGLGLMFVERLCRGLDWRLVQADDPSGHATIRIETRS